MNECKGNKKVLFISGSLGLGHVTRDLAIARELRRHDPELEISWLAAPPAAQLIETEGARLLPEAARFGNLSLAGVYKLSAPGRAAAGASISIRPATD